MNTKMLRLVLSFVVGSLAPQAFAGATISLGVGDITELQTGAGVVQVQCGVPQFVPQFVPQAPYCEVVASTDKKGWDVSRVAHVGRNKYERTVLGRSGTFGGAIDAFHGFINDGLCQPPTELTCTVEPVTMRDRKNRDVTYYGVYSYVQRFRGESEKQAVVFDMTYAGAIDRLHGLQNEGLCMTPVAAGQPRQPDHVTAE